MCDSVSCEGCGFLGVETLYADGLVEPPADFRSFGVCPNGYSNVPKCYIGHNIEGRVRLKSIELGLPPNSLDPLATAKTLREKTTCEDFCKYIPGLSPSEFFKFIEKQKQNARNLNLSLVKIALTVIAIIVSIIIAIIFGK